MFLSFVEALSEAAEYAQRRFGEFVDETDWSFRLEGGTREPFFWRLQVGDDVYTKNADYYISQSLSSGKIDEDDVFMRLDTFEARDIVYRASSSYVECPYCSKKIYIQTQTDSEEESPPSIQQQRETHFGVCPELLTQRLAQQEVSNNDDVILLNQQLIPIDDE